jgi:hypothetical protein
METLLSICVGVGLATACGLRVFVPLLVLSIASHFGRIPLSPGFHWISSYPALLAFSVAAALEIAGYYLPWIDNLLDAAATPSAVLAGTIVSVALMTDVPPFYKWALGVIAGGGLAGLVQGTTVVARGVSSAGTGGLANPLIATAELAGSVVISVLSLWVPVLAIVVLLVVITVVIVKLWRKRAKSAVLGRALSR